MNPAIEFFKLVRDRGFALGASEVDCRIAQVFALVQCGIKFEDAMGLGESWRSFLKAADLQPGSKVCRNGEMWGEAERIHKELTNYKNGRFKRLGHEFRPPDSGSPDYQLWVWLKGRKFKVPAVKTISTWLAKDPRRKIFDATKKALAKNSLQSANAVCDDNANEKETCNVDSASPHRALELGRNEEKSAGRRERTPHA